MRQPNITINEEIQLVTVTIPQVDGLTPDGAYVDMTFDEFQDWTRAMNQEINNARRRREGRAQTDEVALHLSARSGPKPDAGIGPGDAQQPGLEENRWKRKPKK